MSTQSEKLILVGPRCIKDSKLRTAAQKFSDRYEICFSDTGIEYAGSLDDTGVITMVYDEFTDEIFHKLSTRGCCIMGPQIVIAAAEKDPPALSRRRRPVYNNALKDQVICFTGFNERSQISQLASLVHYMNGTIRKDYSPNVTHVVANHCKGEKYKKAVSLGRPIMQHDWVHQLWEKRDNPSITANSPEMMQFRAPPFLRCGIAFHGFSEADVKEMEEIAMTNGGQLCQSVDSECTHIVVDNKDTLPHDVRSSIALVKAEWFWASVQMEVCADERLYAVQVEGRENTPSKLTPSKSRYSLSRSKKRKRHLRENLAALASEGEITPGSAHSYKSRRSSADHLNASLISGDLTPDSSGCLLERKLPSAVYAEPDSPSPSNVKKTPKSPTPEKALLTSSVKPSAKKLVVGELLQTEINYCRIMSNVLKIFRDGAENTEQPGGAILSNTDSKIIFGKIPPILEVHEEIKVDLENLLENWTDDVAVADIILTKVEKLRSAYPPFVNYFEKTKEKIVSCMKTNHRFHAFMKVCERKPECGRQGLADLMMNVVQRLPRIELLLQQIHKYTDKKSSDYRNLELAQSDLKDVTTHINEDKRITDERMVLFEIMNDIENCPPNLLSASRNFILKVDVDEVSDILAGRGEHLTLFIFSDSIEIVKRRHKATTTPFKSPAANKSAKETPSNSRSKPFKHLEFMTLQSIKRIIDITMDEDGGFTDGSSPIFCLLCRKVTDTREKLLTFQIQDPDNIDKTQFMSTLAKNIANSFCRTDYDTLVIAKPAVDFMITPLEGQTSSNKTMTRAVSKFGKRLSRAMTIKGVPSPLKRAVSTIMTPTRRSSMRRNDTSSISSASSMWDLDASLASVTSTVAPDDLSFISTSTNFSPNNSTANRPPTANRRRSIISRVKNRIRGTKAKSVMIADGIASPPIATRTRRQSLWSLQPTPENKLSPIKSMESLEIGGFFNGIKKGLAALVTDNTGSHDDRSVANKPGTQKQSTPINTDGSTQALDVTPMAVTDVVPSCSNDALVSQSQQKLKFVLPTMDTTPCLSARKRQSTHVIRSILSTSKKAKTTVNCTTQPVEDYLASATEVFGKLRKSLQPIADAFGVLPATPAKSDNGEGTVEAALTPGYLNQYTQQ